MPPRTELTNSNLYNRLLSLLSQPKCRNSPFNSVVYLKQTHSLLTTFGHPQNTFFFTKLLLHSLPFFPKYTHFDIPYSSTIFDRIQNPDIYLWNSMIQAFSTSPDPQMSIAFFKQMRENGVSPDRHTFPLLLKAVARANGEDPFQIYGNTVKFGLNRDEFVQNSLVSVFANCGFVGYARKVFDEMLDKNVISWTAMIDGYLRNDCADKGLELFAEMRGLGVRVDEITVVSVLRAVGMMGDVWFGRWVHGFYVECGRVCWDVYVGSALVDMYSKCGCCDDAWRVFKEMPYRNLVTWTTMISGCVQCSRFKDALDIFEEMLLENVKPNQATLASVLTACAQLGALDQGKWVHKYIDMNKFKIDSILGTALVDLYSKSGCIHEAFLVFKKIPVKNVYVWTVMINALAMHGDAAGSLSLFYEMLNVGIRPSRVTLIGVLSACSHGGFVDEGRNIFESMSEVYGLEPDTDHYGCMVDLLGRAGCLEEALGLIESMPMEPTPGVWGALFGACMIHKDYELGEKVGKHLIELQPHHSGRYALLANLYSACQNWEAVAQLRKLMKGKHVDKSPGCSWIELSGAIHEFIAFDKSHTEAKSIYEILDSIAFMVEYVGCPLDTGTLPFDIQ